MNSVWNAPLASQAARDDLKTNFVGLYGLDHARLSDLLLDQLVHARASGEVDAFAVTDILAELEGQPGSHGTKTNSQYRRSESPLKGLWKAHFFDPRFMAKNLLNELNSKHGTKALNDYFEARAGTLLDEQAAGEIADLMVTKAFDRRSQQDRLTGEWIVYAVEPNSGRNYYLTLAAHDEGDEAIFQRLQARLSPEFLQLLPAR